MSKRILVVEDQLDNPRSSAICWPRATAKSFSSTPASSGCEGIVSKRLGSFYRSGRSRYWVKIKNPKAPAVEREVEEDWGR